MSAKFRGPGLKSLFPLFLTLAACSSPQTHKKPASGTGDALQPHELVVVTTTDFHAALQRGEGLASVIRGLKERYGEHMIYLDGGDLFQGSLEGNMSKGRSIVEYFNALGLDAAAIGNHELDYGPDVAGRVEVRAHEDGMGNLRKRVHEATFAWLSANYVRAKASGCTPKHSETHSHCNALGQRTIFSPHAVFERAGRKVCVIGVTTPSTASITRPAFIRGMKFTPLKEVVRAEARFLREKEGCDTVLLTAHAGLLCEDETHCHGGGDRAEIAALLSELAPHTLDAVVAGHTHLLGQDSFGGTPVIEAGTGAKFVGVLHLRNEGPSFEPFIPVPATANVPDITALLKPYRMGAADLKKRPVGTAKGIFPRTYLSEGPLGNMIADALHEAATQVDSVDFAMINAGGIRADLPAGRLTYGDVFTVLPFDNSLAIVDLRGSELRQVLEIALSGGHGVAPVSGLHIKRINVAPGERGPWDHDLNGDGKPEDWERRLLVEITDDAGRPLDDAKHYKLATLDFLATGGDHEAIVYDGIPDSRKRIFQGVWVRDIVTDYLGKHPMIRPDNYYWPSKPRIENIAPSK